MFTNPYLFFYFQPVDILKSLLLFQLTYSVQVQYALKSEEAAIWGSSIKNDLRSLHHQGMRKFAAALVLIAGGAEVTIDDHIKEMISKMSPRKFHTRKEETHSVYKLVNTYQKNYLPFAGRFLDEYLKQ